jgi:hypothetical protein
MTFSPEVVDDDQCQPIEPIDPFGNGTPFALILSFLHHERTLMLELANNLYPAAAIGYSLLYLLFGGGLFGAVIVFFAAKALGR